MGVAQAKECFSDPSPWPTAKRRMAYGQAKQSCLANQPPTSPEGGASLGSVSLSRVI
ncbi:hypothetical protein PCANC_27853 [Puccinia coronata f. sp. avenae]|uniref:Uncharacterized protein n=1 Tax=Puccinia coronata f. sp. avenae TaxID=200324 RepID=A0A2N5TQE5_9BASI|nr:hypothetical protein PCANC_27853 [Puccinia coronata f. sp. avenae]